MERQGSNRCQRPSKASTMARSVGCLPSRRYWRRIGSVPALLFAGRATLSSGTNLPVNTGHAHPIVGQLLLKSNFPAISSLFMPSAVAAIEAGRGSSSVASNQEMCCFSGNVMTINTIAVSYLSICSKQAVFIGAFFIPLTIPSVGLLPPVVIRQSGGRNPPEGD